MFVTCLVRIPFLVLICSCLTSTYQHDYGSKIQLFNDMNPEDTDLQENLENDQDEAGETIRKTPDSQSQTAFSTWAITSEENHKTDRVEAESEATDRKKCDEESFDAENCTKYITEVIQKRSTGASNNFVEEIDDFLKELPICWDIDGSFVHIDPRRQVCCNGVVNKTTHHEKCCGGTVIDERDSLCCNDVKHAKSNTTGCCGMFVYERNTHVCCSNTLHPVLPDMECCGNEIFNNKTQMCCHDNIQNKKGNCCHDTSYHEGCYTCGNSSTLTPFYDELTQICCNGEIFQRLYGNNTRCCRRGIINTDAHACVDGKMISKTTRFIRTDILTSSFNMSMTVDEDNGTTLVLTQHGGNGFEGEKVVLVTKYSTAVGGVIGVIVLIALGVQMKKCILNKKKQNNKAGLSGDVEYTVASQESFIEDASSTRRLIGVSSKVAAKDDDAVNKDCENSELQCLIVEKECRNDDRMTRVTYTNDAESMEGIKISFKGPSVISTDIMFPNLGSLFKSRDITINSNLTKNYFKDNDTQTGLDNENICFRRTIFGQRFEHTFMLDNCNSNLTIPNSDVSLTLPRCLTENGQVEINCTCFDSLPDLRNKLGLSDDEELASAVAEFVISGHDLLPGHAQVVIPFMGDASDLIVKKFRSDEGLNTVAVSMEIPERTKENEDLDIWYTVEGSSIIVHTTSFSGYYCTRQRHRREVDLSLRAFIFGSYKRINKKFAVGVSVYIADKIFELKAYQKRMLKNEVELQERILLKDIPLNMPEHDLDDQDFIEARIFIEDEWVHKKHPGKNRPIQEARKEVRLEEIAKKCTQCSRFHPDESEIPYCTEWYITAPDNTIPPEIFQCTIDLNICKRGTEPKTENSIFIEALELRAQDRLPKQEDDIYRRIALMQSVEETCGPVLPETEARELPRSGGATVSQIPTRTIDNRITNATTVRGERSQLPVHSYSESDMPGTSSRRRVRPEYPGPELSVPFITDRLPELTPVTNGSESFDVEDINKF